MASQRASCLVGLCRRVKYILPKTALRLFRSLIPPLFEYCAPALFFCDHYVAKFEGVQLRCLRSLLGLMKTTKNESVRIIAGVPPVSARLEYLRAKSFCKLLGKPDNFLARRAVFSGCPRAGLFGEMRKLFERMEMDFPPSQSSDFGRLVGALRRRIFSEAFASDMAALKCSARQARIFRILFPANTSYYRYLPLDICTNN